MTFRDDVRDHFAREEAHFPTPTGLRQSVVAEAMVSEPMPRRQLTLAAAVAVVLAAAIVAGLLAVGALRNQQILPVASPKASPTPVAAGATSVVEVSAIDQSTVLELLETVTNNRPRFWFTKSTDGGAHWTAPMQVGPQLSPGEGDSGHHIYFVDADNGFIYGNSTAFVTHDGGRTWKSIGLKFLEVDAVRGTPQATWVVTYPCEKGVVCAFKLYLSRDEGRTWAQSWDLPTDVSPGFVAAFGTEGLVLTGPGVGDMYITADGGQTWQTVGGRCLGTTSAAYTTTSDGRELWQACGAAFPDFAPKTLFVSEDGGATWAKRVLPAVPGQVAFERSVGFVSPSPATAFLVTDGIPIEATHDAGKTWKAMTSSSTFEWISFTSPTDGWALQFGRVLWLTTDGGKTWAQRP